MMTVVKMRTFYLEMLSNDILSKLLIQKQRNTRVVQRGRERNKPVCNTLSAYKRTGYGLHERYKSDINDENHHNHLDLIVYVKLNS